MEERVKSETTKVESTIYGISVTLLVFALESLYSLKESHGFEFVGGGIADFVISVAASGALFYIILVVVRIVYSHWWKGKHPDLYLEGEWYHIHGKEKDPDYIKVGTVRVRQYFYDLEFSAENYAPKLNKDGKFSRRDDHLTYWNYLVSEVNESGDVLGVYRARRRYGTTRINEGIHKMSILELDDRGFPILIAGEFADCFPSDSEGYLRLFRASIGPSDRRNRIELNDNMYPVDWVDEVQGRIDNIEQAAKHEALLGEMPLDEDGTPERFTEEVLGKLRKDEDASPKEV